MEYSPSQVDTAPTPLRAAISVAVALLVACLIAGCGGGSPASPGAASHRRLTPTQQQHVLLLAQRYSKCMQTHGVTTFPNPTIDRSGHIRIGIGPAGLDPNTAQFQRAEKACQALHARLP